MAITLRPATADDIELLFDIRTSVQQNHLTREQLHALGITALALADAINAAPCAWVAEADRQAVGFAMVDLDEGELFALFIRPNFEARGIGRLLLQQAEQALFQHHALIHLTTDGDEATRANGFYRRHGWLASGAVDDRDVRFEKHRGSAQ